MITNRFFILLSFVALVVSAHAQVIINPSPVAGFQVASDDLLNFNVIYSGIAEVKVRYLIEVSKEGEGQVLQMMSTGQKLRTGVNSYNKLNLNLQLKKYSHSTIAHYERVVRSLPAGNYNYCIKIECLDDKESCLSYLNAEAGLSECIDFNIISTTPLLLSMPEDEAVIEEQRPNFSWIPPMPIGNDPSVTYTFQLVKLQKNQRGEDAIVRNRPLYANKGIKSTLLSFPSTLNNLKKGKMYAWQVKAYLDNMFLTASEVWEFEIKESFESETFVDITSVPNGIHKCDETLNILYNSLGEEEIFSYKIINSIGEDITPQDAIYLDKGANRIIISKDDLTCKHEEILTLKVKTIKGRRYSIRFQYI